ncbi:hypothetical protein Cgig2_006917 [Carnegiea gigantea]|uniref:DNA repair protein UVH3 n=1 Tax=Carnegiea gigantea TaxID=171969 RepID=A0A9Q1GSJ9_9CARY|nr:hypothetical protein Cgig2_006917 [Carnegiea gigantea]
MGVHGIWDLLAPVGRRVSVETLAGKRLAIDASIWMVQFMKAMRDEKGEMVRNAHLLGFFRRICKLLFVRTKPVFVFDGGTPALKRRTVIARRRQRENAQAKIRKTAEKLLMNHLKAMRLKNLAEDLKDQRAKNDKIKGKGVMLEQSNTLKKNDDVSKSYNQEMIDEMLVASILAEESGGLDAPAPASRGAINGKNDDVSASTSGAAFLTEDEDDENDEEMILPITNGNVDPAVLAALPPSMQLDLLVQMRERLMAENRQKYQKVKKAPQKFSELQIEAYLKTVAFRREIDEVQRAAAGKGVAGVQTSRIASEANREFIFSSSFSGDKQLLASGGADKNPGEQQSMQKKDSSFDMLRAFASAAKSNAVAGATADEPVGDFANEIQTFLDERGRMRVSRRRAMGIRMTRDLQRNIDLMKELEKETTTNNLGSDEIEVDKEQGRSTESHCVVRSSKSVSNFDGDTVDDTTEKSLLETAISNNEVAISNNEVARGSQTCINVSFDDYGETRPLNADDEFFSRLVAGNEVSICSAGNSSSDCEWEEGIICKQTGDLGNENKLEPNTSHTQYVNSEPDVEWEEVTCLIDGNKSEMKSLHVEDTRHNDNKLECQEGATNIREYVSEFSTDGKKVVSKGSVEEEAALREAIRRSLEDLTGRKTSNISSELEKSDYICKTSFQWESCRPDPSSKLGSVLQDNGQSQSFVSESDGFNFVARKGNCAPAFADTNSGSATAVTAVKGSEAAAASTSKESGQIGNKGKNSTHVPTYLSGANSLHANSVNDITTDEEAAFMRNSGDVSDSGTGRVTSIVQEQESDSYVKSNMAKEDIFLAGLQEQGNDVEFSAEDDIVELVGASLEDELLALGQEYNNLEGEQRKLERNADSVNAEMFVECQVCSMGWVLECASASLFFGAVRYKSVNRMELLQMFGLPYIIAPMEAEAQCAYMELANLVDGVVTDDSDVFLFGARSVYKNIFDDRKYVETYFMKDIESELGLNREKLIRMALLLGSDYTEGVSGIGIVNAIEVVNAFPEEDGLCKFREWVESPDPTILGKIGVQAGSNSKRRGSKASKSGKSDCKTDKEGTSISDCYALQDNEDDHAIDDNINLKQAFMDTHEGYADWSSLSFGVQRNVSKNWHIPASFPSDAVISAYTAPQVDKSTEPFAWGKPDIFLLRKVCWEKFGWASQKADELLLPVLKEYNKHETQLRLEAFYTFDERFAKIRSKRIKQAVKGITGKRSSELASTDDLKDVPENPKRREVSSTGDRSKNKELTDSSGCIDGETINSVKKLKSQQKRRYPKEASTSDGGSTVLLSKAEERRLNSAGSSRARGRRKAKAAQRGRRKDDPDSEVDETSIHISSSSATGSEHKDELQVKKEHLGDIVRRSKRARKDINYADADEENDEPTVFPSRTSQSRSIGVAAEQLLSQCPNVAQENVANSSGVTELTPEGPSPGDILAGDYLVDCGGFCADEDHPEVENDRVGSIQNEESSFKADKEYLQMGGGFCVEDDEDQEGNEPAGNASDQSDSSMSPESTPDNQASPKAQEMSLSDQNNTSMSNDAENTETGATRSSVNALSAIPFLKRKRRKN